MKILDNRLDMLLENYLENKIDVKSFTHDFSVIYCQETDYTSLGSKKDKLYGELEAIASRYSSSKEEIERYKVHYAEEVVRAKAQEVWLLLNERQYD